MPPQREIQTRDDEEIAEHSHLDTIEMDCPCFEIGNDSQNKANLAVPVRTMIISNFLGFIHVRSYIVATIRSSASRFSKLLFSRMCCNQLARDESREQRSIYICVRGL